MKYIKQFNIDFNEWDSYELPPITIDLLCYLKVMTGNSVISLNNNIKQRIYKYGFDLVFKFVDYYCHHMENLNDDIEDIIYQIFNEVNINNKNKYYYSIFSVTELISIIKKSCMKCNFNINKIKYYYETYYKIH